MIFFVSLLLSLSQPPELIIGQEKVLPGIVFIFEGAVKDNIFPSKLHLPEDQTHVHIEARANWDDKQIPKGATPNGFVPYLNITATITNSKSGQQLFVDLKPHINLIDNFHYARNVALPGSVKDNYDVQFNVIAPSNIELALHNDWVEKYGKNLLNDYTFYYKSVNFKQIAEAIRN